MRYSFSIDPRIPVQRDHYLCTKTFSGAQDVRGNHFVLYADGILAESEKGHVNVEALALLGKPGRKIRVAAMVDSSRRGLDKIAIERSSIDASQADGVYRESQCPCAPAPNEHA